MNEFNKLERGALLTWDDFWRALTSQTQFPAIKARMSHYVGSSAHDILATHQFPPTMTYKQLVSVMYQDSRRSNAPRGITAWHSPLNGTVMGGSRSWMNKTAPTL
ncbi:MAG: hypothetical protein HC933_18605 [Pleurocapsa sp. SU_196_0]|nr:hypothetical protein [Pleurocapsa sp. SU_196_0]